MRVVGEKILEDCIKKHPHLKSALQDWLSRVKNAHWQSGDAIRNSIRQSRPVSEGKVIFGRGGAPYRIITKVNYQAGAVLILFAGTHAEYDKYRKSH